LDRDEIKQNLIDQLTGAVKWTQCVQAMIADGATKFIEAGPGKVLQGLILKIDKSVQTEGVS
jgi:[acyl-carrier-protein] S-malonyltransferase